MSGGSAAAGSLGGIHVLLVAEDTDSRELVKTVLDYAGALVTVAGSARAALSLMESVRPDVLLSDLRSSGEDAYWLIREIRTLPLLAGTPAAAVTARADARRALDAGFNAQLGTPIDPWELCEVLAQLANAPE